MDMDYAALSSQWAAAAPFKPPLPVESLPTLALLLLVSSFGLAFYTSTLPKVGLPAKEVALAAAASVLLGFGTVFAFCAVGVPV